LDDDDDDDDDDEWAAVASLDRASAIRRRRSACLSRRDMVGRGGFYPPTKRAFVFPYLLHTL
jgi:hypothetical protein